MKQKYAIGTGKYYFNVHGETAVILIHRDTKEEAIQGFLRYKRSGKSCEWLGLWNGNSFIESTVSA
ncbi:MAG: hypothetical protein HC892_03210 [Saprospiraceae bacterium]|nr:hypothetical protein [Saprospiraceae bacterium]